MDTGSGGQRYSPITPDNHAGILWIVALLSLIFSVLSLVTRSYVKRNKWWYDDTVCTIATVFGIASFAAVAVGLNHGLGKASFLLEDDQLSAIGKVCLMTLRCIDDIDHI
jgi:hypothetical protein